jgi:glycosyltransferase involved in cell wall biosynthesis
MINNNLKIVVAIPCLNEARFIGDIVRRIDKTRYKVIVIDDGSKDDTAEVALANGAEVIKHPYQMGAGAATKSCFEAAKKENADILVTLDGDGQHNPDEIDRVAAPAINKEADFVIGSRFIKPDTNMPLYRRLGIYIINLLCNIGAKVKVTDTQSCFRAYNRKFLDTVSIAEQSFSFSIELLINARRAGLKIKEVPISCVYHDQGSSMNPIRHGINVAWTIIKMRWGKNRR